MMRGCAWDVKNIRKIRKDDNWVILICGKHWAIIILIFLIFFVSYCFITHFTNLVLIHFLHIKILQSQDSLPTVAHRQYAPRNSWNEMKENCRLTSRSLFGFVLRSTKRSFTVNMLWSFRRFLLCLPICFSRDTLSGKDGTSFFSFAEKLTDSEC